MKQPGLALSPLQPASVNCLYIEIAGKPEARIALEKHLLGLSA